MKIERVFNENTSLTIQDIIQSLINEKIDILVSDYYHQIKVNTSTSQKEGIEVA
jgi:hypothetical protein